MRPRENLRQEFSYRLSYAIPFERGEGIAEVDVDDGDGDPELACTQTDLLDLGTIVVQYPLRDIAKALSRIQAAGQRLIFCARTRGGSRESIVPPRQARL